MYMDVYSMTTCVRQKEKKNEKKKIEKEKRKKVERERDRGRDMHTHTHPHTVWTCTCAHLVVWCPGVWCTGMMPSSPSSRRLSIGCDVPIDTNPASDLGPWPLSKRDRGGRIVAALIGSCAMT